MLADIPCPFQIQAWTPDGVLMGIEHRRLCQYGVQFHPESVATQYGHSLLANFRDLTLQRMKKKRYQPPPLLKTTASGGREKSVGKPTLAVR